MSWRVATAASVGSKREVGFLIPPLPPLLQAAIRDPDPVVFLENEIMYGQSFPVKPEVLDKDFTLPLGKAKVMREGTDVTLVSFSRQASGERRVGSCALAEERACALYILRSLHAARVPCARFLGVHRVDAT